MGNTQKQSNITFSYKGSQLIRQNKYNEIQQNHYQLITGCVPLFLHIMNFNKSFYYRFWIVSSCENFYINCKKIRIKLHRHFLKCKLRQQSFLISKLINSGLIWMQVKVCENIWSIFSAIRCPKWTFNQRLSVQNIIL